MDTLTEWFKPGYLVIAAFLLFFLIIGFKIIKNISKGILMMGVLIIVVLLFMRFAPGVIQPMVDFVQGGWLGD